MDNATFWIQGKFPAPGAVRRIVAFGDSLSDTGFAQGSGFGRYSNGPTWVEYLARRLDAALFCRAWGGARTDRGNCSGPEDWSGLAWQIVQHDCAGDPEETLYAVLAGVNDLCDGDGDPQATAERLVAAHDALQSNGAAQILMLTLPDLSRAPAYHAQERYRAVRAAVHERTLAANRALLGLLRTRPCMVFDAAGLFAALLDAGYRNTAEPWLGTHSYPDPQEYFWWDEWHPMTSVHERLADAVAVAGPASA